MPSVRAGVDAPSSGGRSGSTRAATRRYDRGVRVLGAQLVGVVAVAAACSSSEATTEPPDGGGEPASALPQACPRGPRAASAPAACNGTEALCGRRFDQVVTPMTHNAMASAADGFTPPSQTHDLARQLRDGVRGMMLDVHGYDPETNQTDTGRVPRLTAADQLYLCHGSCALGKRRLLDSLCTLTGFLDEHPGEVLSIIFETYVADADLAAVLEASGLAERAYAHALGAPWPTLGEMIERDQRVVIFVEKGGGAPPYLMPAYEGLLWDTPYAFRTQADFTCARGRGVAGSPVFLVNHWLSRPFGDVALAREANAAAVLGARVSECTQAAGRAPTFVGVDFYEVGDLLSVVRQANGL